MGAISGIVVIGSDTDAAPAGSAIFEKLKACSFERTGEWTDHSVHLGCGIIYNTPESRLEELPRSNESRTLVLTADAIIDNRAELLESFKLEPEESRVITDSELILRAYEAWGYSCPEHLIGDYAFALWDAGKQELFLARDAMGSRTLYYSYERGFFAFCTIETPLLKLFGRPAELNEKWIADFLAIDGIQHEMECEETVYRGIYQLPPAHYGIVNAEGFSKKKYWEPLRDIKPIRFKTDEEYVEAFKRCFSEAVECRLRSAGETGIFLSGGMDSGSIACVAAPKLAEKGKKLHGFTSIPVPEFNERPPRMTIYNESREVGLIAEAYPNIGMTYSSFADKNCLTDIDELIQVFEQPYKVFQNMTWYHSFLKLAAERNCAIMLNGQTGNNTISYGNFAVHLVTLSRQGRIVSAARELYGFSRLVNEPVTKVLKSAIPVVLPHRLKLWRHRTRLREFDRFHNVVVKRSLVHKWNVTERLDQIEANTPISRFPDYEEDRKARTSPLPFTHIGAVETKLSLASGITIRDPSRDKRVFEFCLAIPSGQFVRSGQERYLLRRAMKGILPDPIRLNIVAKGLQSADWVHRLAPIWSGVLAEAGQALEKGNLEPYVEVDKLREKLAKAGGDVSKAEDSVVRSILTAVIFSRFIEDFKQRHS
ncbi:asparagine synthase (glutamine-hydrolyzing) [Paenibacillus forsythiae]|uniref:asparagine synthase (glutamine-hydrolyzing) n=1 Tax=Paenibacillus forsythiae TaxID=365616 RepID=A0ABU3HFJ2_9BACL|nr:asparagine synthase-related protein [Paenibacillus forsythiae]MDT3428822.1 asparagine synthase (glutamine-hydrolyzing) [Paenibacillus forsythiae]